MEDKRNSGVWLAGSLILLLVLPILYVLSLGPYASVYGRSPDPDWAMTLYAPWIWLMEHSELAARILRGYMRLWIPDEP